MQLRHSKTSYVSITQPIKEPYSSYNRKKLCFERVDLPIDEEEGDANEDQIWFDLIVLSYLPLKGYELPIVNKLSSQSQSSLLVI